MGRDRSIHFGRKVSELRSKSNVNLRGFARTVGASPAWVSYVERGERVPSWPLVENMVRFFKTYNASQKDLKQLHLLGRKLMMRKTFSLL